MEKEGYVSVAGIYRNTDPPRAGKGMRQDSPARRNEPQFRQRCQCFCMGGGKARGDFPHSPLQAARDPSYAARMSDTLVCRPTRWFYQRAFGMLAMFTFLGGWFFKDATTGYRKENLAFVMHRTFAIAAKHLQEKQKEGAFTAAQWRDFAATQTVPLDDPSLYPAGTPQPLPWPEELCELDLLAKGHTAAWESYTGRMKWNRKAPDKFHEAGSIREQWYVAYGLSSLALFSLFILVRTSRRKISIEGDAIHTQDGRRVALADLTRLDLRKWATKGMAYAFYPDRAGKEARIRIDGLTYGGFQKELGEPAEQLMRIIRGHFTGELLEYAAEEPAETEKTGE